MNEITFSEVYEPLFKVLTAWKEGDEELSKVDTILISGGRDCFTGNQKIVTSNGSISIKDINIGDMVLTRNELLNINEYKPVVKTKKVRKNHLIRIKLKNGKTIECTPDHEFYHNGCWIKIKDLLSLFYGEMEKNKKV